MRKVNLLKLQLGGSPQARLSEKEWQASQVVGKYRRGKGEASNLDDNSTFK